MKEHLSRQVANFCKSNRNLLNSLLQERLGLYAGQEMFLEHLAQHDGSSLRDLATSLRVEAPTITRMVQRLEQGQLIERRPDPDDARVSRLYITEAGRAVQQEIYAVWEQIEAITLTDFSEEESALLRRLLKKAQDNMTMP